MVTKKIFKRIRKEFFPNEADRMLNKYWHDGGDYKLRFNYKLNENSIVLDIGGFKGEWASDLFSRYLCNISIFEPVSMLAVEIEKRFNNNDKIKVYQYGLGGKSRKERISICAESSSIFRKSDRSEEIKIIDIAEWITNKKIKTISLMKINIEGGEYELLERLIETNLIKIVENIQVQFHNVFSDSATRMKNIQKNLEKTHLATYQYLFVWENWTRKNYFDKHGEK